MICLGCFFGACWFLLVFTGFGWYWLVLVGFVSFGWFCFVLFRLVYVAILVSVSEAYMKSGDID